jgi:hypothetical protein
MKSVPNSLSMTRKPTGDLAEKPVKAMDTPSTWQKHQWTLSWNHLHPLLLAERDRFLADCPSSSCPVHQLVVSRSKQFAPST